ncbi:MAG: hypothetical protein ABJO09_08895 [Hyphomicrobiales bacterium]
MKHLISKFASVGLKTASAAAVITVGLAGSTVLLSGTAAEAAVQSISCPVEKIRRTVTTALPDGWWHTPIVNTLQSTKIVRIGGKNALQCNYGSAGKIQRYAPTNARCQAIASGFRCEVRVAAGPQTFSTGEVNIPQTYSVDLDRGRLTGAGADIWFRAETRDLLYFSPRNGARIGVGNRSNRGFRGCSTARYTTERVSLRDIPVGSYVCVKTDKGRISQFRVNRVAGSPKTVTIGYTTWK